MPIKGPPKIFQSHIKVSQKPIHVSGVKNAKTNNQNKGSYTHENGD
jgi:hypothetical protein